MKKIKEVILEKSLELFNELGVAEVSIRNIAAAIGISHSNLMYHYKTRQEIIEVLHDQLLERAMDLNEKTRSNDDFISGLFESTEKGFNILYEYRFLMIDLNHIIRENERLKKAFLKVEKIRAGMYQEAISRAIQQGYMRERLYENEYDTFIEQIKIFSDFWISSSEIYDTDGKEIIIKKYAMLFAGLFFPYLTEKGRKGFDQLMKTSE